MQKFISSRKGEKKSIKNIEGKKIKKGNIRIEEQTERGKYRETLRQSDGERGGDRVTDTEGQKDRYTDRCRETERQMIYR